MSFTQLNTIIVVASQGGSGSGTPGGSGFSYWGLPSTWLNDISTSAYSAAYGFAAAMEEFIEYASSADWTAEWLNGLSTLDNKTIKDSLILFSNVANISASASYAVATYINAYQDTVSKIYDNTLELHFGSGMPIAAFAHYLFGAGSDLNVDINELGLQIEVSEIPTLQALVDSNVIGSQPVSLGFDYSTYSDNQLAGFTVGNIPLYVEGEFIRTSASEWSFNGVITGGTDRYNGNMDVSRSIIAQGATAVLAALEATGDGTPYDINITGGFHVNLNQSVGMDWF